MISGRDNLCSIVAIAVKFHPKSRFGFHLTRPMKLMLVKPRSRSTAVSFSVLCCALFLSSGAHALFKVIGPDGKVSYTDQAPLEPGSNKVTSLATDSKQPSSISNLPADLRQAVAAYPVVLYSLPNACEPCDQGRELLKQRGIPFTERLIVTNADVESLNALTGSRDTPVMVIGSQVSKGFSATVWNQYFDLAGYPKESRLPANFSFGQATPLTKQQAATTPTTDSESAGRAPRPTTRAPAARAPAPPAPSAPDTIKF